MSLALARERHLAPAAYDVEAVRADFPILATRVNNRPLVYLDTAASAQKPQAVIDALSHFYANDYANIHRGMYELSQRASARHDEARRKVQRFIGALDWREVVFVRNATEGINLVAQSYLRPRLKSGDEILITAMEHHANIVPWQLVAEATGARLVVAPITDGGEIDLAAFDELLGPRTRMVAVAWVSNVLGTVNPIADLVRLAHEAGAPILIDAAQAVQHLQVDVAELGCDFLVFSGHKLYGPSGVGVLWGRLDHLDAMPPWQGGGDMIDHVRFDGTTFNEVPFRFEAGTPDIAGIVALGAAIDYVEALGIEAIAAHEAAVFAHATRALNQVPGLRLLSDAARRVSVLSFEIEGVHPQDLATMLDLDGIAIRTGHHCAEPLHARLGLTGSARASLGLYTTTGEIDALVQGLGRATEMLR